MTNTQKRTLISNDYIRGLTEGEGSFTFCTNTSKQSKRKYKYPTFCLIMHARDKELILGVCNRLRLNNAVYEYTPLLEKDPKTGYKKCITARLIVREYEQLKNIIIPFFYKQLHGYKELQFNAWLEKIGEDNLVSPKFKTLYQLYKQGYYDNPPCKWFWEEERKA